MKKFLNIFGIIAIIFLIAACKKQSPKDYNDKIIKEQITIVKKMTDLKNAINDYNILPADVAIENMNKAYDSLVFQIDTSTKFVTAIGPFKKDETLKKAALVLFNSYLDITENNYKKVIELYKLPTNLFTEKESKELDSLKNDAAVKIDSAFETFSKIQKKFADENNLNLIEKK